MSSKTTSEDLAALAATGVIDGVEILQISEYDKKMSGLPVRPPGVTASLREVSIDSAKFTNWNSIYVLGSVRELVVDRNVKELPPGISGMTSLERLTVRGKLSRLPEDVTGLRSLRSLTIASAALTELPEKLGELLIEELILDGTTKIKALPDSLGTCATLRILRTRRAALKALPEGVYTLPVLEVLAIMDSKLSKLGPRIDWPAMRELDLQAAYTKWPKEMSIPKLEQAVLGEKFDTLPDLFVPSLRRIWVNAPLKEVDPRFASLENRLESRERGAPMMGVMMSCTSAAYEALSDPEREAFGSRLKPSWK